MLAAMRAPAYPVALGIIRSVDEPTYDERLVKQVEEVQTTRVITCVDELLNSEETWEVE